MRALRLLIYLALAALCTFGRQVDITLLVTTDLHGNIYPYDYLTGRHVDRGLAKIATLINEERKKAPNSLLIDCGDTIQGAPLESVYQQWVRTGKFPLGLKPASTTFSLSVGSHRIRFGCSRCSDRKG